jgi:hypothetical protein
MCRPLTLACLTALLTTASLRAEEGDKPTIVRKVSAALSSAVAPVLAPKVEQPVSSEVPSHPVLIRVDSKAFSNAGENHIDTVRPVKCVIVGTPVTGKSHTVGDIQVQTGSTENNAVFLISFNGRTHTRTSGLNGPAQIHSHTDTNFTVWRRVTMSPLEGFKSEQTWYRGNTNMVLDDIQATKPGLRGAIVRRVAWRRAGQSQAQAQWEASRNVKRDVCNSFDIELDHRVAELNKQVNFARYLAGVFGDTRDFDVRANCSGECVQFAVGPASVREKKVAFPEQCPEAPIEIWVHSTAIAKQTKGLSQLVSALATATTPVAATLPMLQSMAWSEDAGPITMRMEKDWIVLSLDASKDGPVTGPNAQRPTVEQVAGQEPTTR